MKLFACMVALVLIWSAWSGNALTYASDGSNINSVNSSVRAEDGQVYGTLSTVNGSVRVGRNSKADEAKTVNGDITLEEQSQVGEVSAVNGSLSIREGVAIEREASTVNGRVAMHKRSRVGGNVATVSGDIELAGGEVGGELRTVNGNIDLTDGARVRGGIHVKKNSQQGWWSKDDPVKVHVCSTCVIEGDLRFERPAELRVDAGGKIGRVIGDNVRRL